MQHESDISWQVLRQIVQDWTGTAAELAQVQPLEGGVINTTLALELKDGQRAVIKISPHRVNREHEREAYQLNLLHEIGVPAPKVFAWKMGSLEEPFSYILMEFVDGVDLAEARRNCVPEQFEMLQKHLAEVVGAMHSRTSDRYMRVMHNGDAFDSWPRFFHHVHDPIWHEVEKSQLLPIKVRKLAGKIHERLDQLLAHEDLPRLVHWDLWASNVLCKEDPATGHWSVSAVLDPNCKYAHAEAEIAYMELFHTCTPAFMKAYQVMFKLPSEYHQVRKPVYHLYSLLDHVQLFGQEYVKPATAAVEKVAAMI
jgi:fructosamine-3-kinase